MLIQFRETFELQPSFVHDYFKSPADWVRLYGFGGSVEDRGNGWYAVPLKRFPFPLVARITANEPGRLVRWIFSGFWKGEGEVRLSPAGAGVTVEGHEQISVRWLGPLSRIPERLFMERQFRFIWDLGWKRLRKSEVART